VKKENRLPDAVNEADDFSRIQIPGSNIHLPNTEFYKSEVSRISFFNIRSVMLRNYLKSNNKQTKRSNITFQSLECYTETIKRKLIIK